MRSEHNTAQQITINQMSYEQEFEELDLEDEQTKVRLLGDAFTESLRYMGSFSQRSLKYFDETACPQQLVAKRMPPVQNMLISKTDFKQNVIKEYQRVKPGEMRQVVAITGGGKSTTFPAEIANYTGENGLILSPRSDLSYFNGAFLSEKFLKQNYPGIQAVQLRSDHVKHPAQGKVLYYDVASSFFMMLAIYPTLLQKLGIKFILFDESHELTGDYKLAELLASAGKFRDVKVMLVSATRGDVNMEQEADTSRRRIVPVAPDLMDLGSLSSLGSNSPLHHSRINNRVLIFCPDFQCINAAKEYYEERDIPVIIHTSASSSRGMTEIQQFYEDHRVSVTLTDRVLQTGFTLDIEDVYCCGYTTELTIDMTSRMIDLKKTPVTMAIRQQRGGRTGRINSGTFYFADIESTMPTDVLSDSSACYLFLWCHLYNLTTNLPEVRKFKEFFGPISHRKVMKLLHSHVHPILAHPYMDLTGNMCHGWERVFDHAMRKATYGASEYDKSAEITADWVYQNIYDQRFVSELESIRVPMSVPEEWAPFFYAVWKVTDTAGKRWPFEERFDRRSVLSVVPLERRSKKSVFRPKAPRDSSATLALDSGSIARTVIAGNRHIVSPIVEDERSVRVAPAVASLEREASPPEPAQLATQKVLPEIPSSPRRPTVETVSLSGPPSHSRGSSLSKIRTVPGKAPVSEMRSPSSAPSLDDYRQVKASTLHVEKVFPYNTDSLGVYLSNTARKEIDVERVRDMAEFRVKIYDMNSDSRHRYMLSLIRCWNYAVAAVSQLSAKQDRPVFFRTFSGRQISKFESDLESFKSLLITFEKERFRFAVMRSSRHSERGKITVQTDSTLVADRLDYIRGCLYVLKVDTQRRGLYLRDADCVLGALHVFENNDRVDRPHGAQVIRFARKDDLVVMGNTAYPNVGLTQLVRQPVDGEDVYIITVSASDEYSVFSGIQIASYAGRWFHTAQGAVGMSSAPIVAKSDGRLVGLHVGGSLVFPEYKGMMAPLYEFLNTDSN